MTNLTLPSSFVIRHSPFYNRPPGSYRFSTQSHAFLALSTAVPGPALVGAAPVVYRDAAGRQHRRGGDALDGVPADRREAFHRGGPARRPARRERADRELGQSVAVAHVLFPARESVAPA